MTDKARIKIAAAVTALFLAGMSAAGLVARDHQPRTAAAAATQTRTAADGATAVAGGDQADFEEIEHDD